tara:strand:- start:6939 stop:7544 length:606 start_codon:yes stop_codon:yes gene_type:complete
MSMKLDTSEFQRALLKYIPTTKRDLPEIVNKRAINVAFKAIRFTPKAKPGKIRRALKLRARLNAPLAALIVNKLQGKYGNKGYYGAEMKSEVEEFIKGKVRGIGYLKSGWLASAQQLARLAGMRVGRSRATKLYGDGDHGKAIKANPGWTPTATIINLAEGIAKVGQMPLQRALNAEAKEILKHVERKMKKSARRHGIKTR